MLGIIHRDQISDLGSSGVLGRISPLVPTQTNLSPLYAQRYQMQSLIRIEPGEANTIGKANKLLKNINFK